ncbi:MAG TPA: hypothetical protein VJN95_12110 [Gemmatimonadales bacterium]|nr:hypothetical protein [Gemmatimonadales bacterium]
MVMTRMLGRRGASNVGCLLSLLVFVAALYYGINIGKVWFRYYQLKDEMTVSARMAPGLTDPTIRHRLEIKVDELGLPVEAKKFTISRAGKQFSVSCEYNEHVSLPFFDHTFVFKPSAVEPL